MNKKLLILPLLAVALVGCSQENKDKAKETTNKAIETTKEKAGNAKNAVEKKAAEAKDAVEDKKADAKSGATIAYEDMKLSPKEAVDIFNKKYPDAKVSAIKVEDPEGDNVYAYNYIVEGSDEKSSYILAINPVSGEVANEKLEGAKKDIKEVGIDKLDSIKDLVEKSVKDAGEGFFFKDWEAENEDGVDKVSIEVKTKEGKDKEYVYNLADGSLLKQDK